MTFDFLYTMYCLLLGMAFYFFFRKGWGLHQQRKIDFYKQEAMGKEIVNDNPPSLGEEGEKTTITFSDLIHMKYLTEEEVAEFIGHTLYNTYPFQQEAWVNLVLNFRDHAESIKFFESRKYEELEKLSNSRLSKMKAQNESLHLKISKMEKDNQEFDKKIKESLKEMEQIHEELVEKCYQLEEAARVQENENFLLQQSLKEERELAERLSIEKEDYFNLSETHREAWKTTLDLVWKHLGSGETPYFYFDSKDSRVLEKEFKKKLLPLLQTQKLIQEERIQVLNHMKNTLDCKEWHDAIFFFSEKTQSNTLQAQDRHSKIIKMWEVLKNLPQ